jgi:hypothetical protein
MDMLRLPAIEAVKEKAVRTRNVFYAWHECISLLSVYSQSLLPTCEYPIKAGQAQIK